MSTGTPPVPPGSDAFKCDRCGAVSDYESGYALDVSPGAFATPLSFEADLCESCARAAKQWISEKPSQPAGANEHILPEVAAYVERRRNVAWEEVEADD